MKLEEYKWYKTGKEFWDILDALFIAFLEIIKSIFEFLFILLFVIPILIPFIRLQRKVKKFIRKK